MPLPRIYLDNAATSWPKPQSVYDAVDDYQRRLGAAVGRGAYAEAEEVGQAVEATRGAIASLIGAESPDCVIFTFNGTDSLNLAIHGALRPGDHVITSVAEHNSVLRPLRRLEKEGRNAVTRVGCDKSGVIDPTDIRAALRPETKLIVLTHASNVTGAIQPVSDVGKIAREHGALFLVDAAQTLGHLPFSVAELGADLLAAPGHKGLLGPLGTGILYIRPGVEELVESIRQGGTGSSSSDDNQPHLLPTKYESGNHNAPGIIGLCAGVNYIQEHGLGRIRQHEIDLTDRLLSGLTQIETAKIYGPKRAESRVGVVSFTLDRLDPLAIAKLLEDEHRIQVRAGFHCAAWMHRTLGTIRHNGTVRISVGPFNGEQDISVAMEALGALSQRKDTTFRHVRSRCVSASPSAELVTPAEAGVTSARATETSAIPGLQDLWQQTTGDSQVCVAVLDGPVDLSHPCFRGAQLSTLPSLVSSQADGGPASQHGTHVASVIFGQHSSAIKGIAPQCRGLAIPIFKDRDANSFAPCSQVDLARAISQAVEAGANIINISGGQFSPSGSAHPILADAVKRCASRGVLVVAAAGNQGCECLHIPGAIPSVLAVGAMDVEGTPLDFSNWGYRTDGVLAVGEGIRGASVGGDTSLRTGTSFATPIVSGLAGLLMSLQRKRGVEPTGHSVRSALIQTAIGCSQRSVANCDRLLAGRINVSAAVATIVNGDNNMTASVHLQAATKEPPMSDAGPRDTWVDSDSGIAASPCESIALAESVEAVATHPNLANSGPAPPISHDLGKQHRQPSADERSSSRSSRIHCGDRSVFASRTTDSASQMTPSGCGCANGGVPPQLVYALGRLTFDYGTLTRRKYFFKAFQDVLKEDRVKYANIDDPRQLANFLSRRNVDKDSKPLKDDPYTILNGNKFPGRAHVAAVTWTLTLDDTPVYAIVPSGPFAFEIHDLLVEFLNDQNEVEDRFRNNTSLLSAPPDLRISVPGFVSGSVRLFTGEIVPVIQPDIRGMYSWTTLALSRAAREAAKASPEAENDLVEFLQRVYDDTRNLGLTSQERALNYAATDALVLQGIFRDVRAKFEGFEFDTFEVVRSPVCRPDADCWDVLLIFYDPTELNRARRAVRFTIDVSDVVPVMIGNRKDFSIR
jgi:cysteine desulfurase family protein